MITEMSDDLIGKRVTCTIQGNVVPDGRIQKEGEKYYICQDKCAGSECKDKLGYKHSWSLLGGTVENIKNHNVDVLQLHPEEVPKQLPIFN
jgi:hypothetical protein